MKRERVSDAIERAQGKHKSGDLEGAESIYHQIFNRYPHDLNVILQLAQINQQKGNIGLAILLYKNVVDVYPDNSEIWNNLGTALKLAQFDEAAKMALSRAYEIDNSNPDYPSNLSSLYINNGTPELAIEWADKAIAIGPNERHGVVQARWHKALALLELKDFKNGWDYHEARLEEGAGCKIEPRNYAKEGMTPTWDGKQEGLLVLHGEQGLGDEIMFSSCIPDIPKNNEIVFECAPRVAGLFKRSFQHIKVVGTHETDGREWLEGRKVDHKLAIGSLPKFYRRNISDFPGTPFLKADPIRSLIYHNRLKELGDRPKVGIAWQGGVIKTRVDLRSVFLHKLQPILSQDADFISLGYHSTAKKDIEELFEQTGLVVHHWDEAATGADMDDQAALIENLDLVISVCQTCNHVAGGLGVPCWVLTPSKPSWREGISGDMPWYKSIKMYRQKESDWDSVVKRVSNDLKGFIDAHNGKLQSAKQEVA